LDDGTKDMFKPPKSNSKEAKAKAKQSAIEK
jgi:hypothetical protein